MTSEERKILVTELKLLTKAVEAGRALMDEKILIRNIAGRLLEEAKAGALARSIALGFFK